MEAVEKSLHQKAKYKRVSLQRKPPHRALIKMASNTDSVFFVFLHFHGESIANNLNVMFILWCLPIFFSFFLLSGSHHSARWHDAGGLCQKVSEEFHQRSGCRTCGNWHHGKNGLYQLTSTPSKHIHFHSAKIHPTRSYLWLFVAFKPLPLWEKEKENHRDGR